MQIDERAPVTARAESLVGAGAREVWDVLADAPGWPQWDPDVHDVVAEGPLVAGATVMWRERGRQVSATVHEAVEGFELGWSTGGGTVTEQVYRLQARRDGTLVAAEASLSGLWPRLRRGHSARRLQQALEHRLSCLDAELGRRAIAAAAHELELAGRPAPPDEEPGEAAA